MDERTIGKQARATSTTVIRWTIFVAGTGLARKWWKSTIDSHDNGIGWKKNEVFFRKKITEKKY